MILYVNGDSHSAGHDAVYPGPNIESSYGKVLADKLNADFVCDATPGCGNDFIINKTLQYLESNTPDFLIIGWSTWERETWYWNNIPYNFTASGTDSVHPMLENFYKDWVINSGKEAVQRQKERDNHVKIYLLHKLLQSKKINHLFFNCYNYFFFNVQYNEERYNWGHLNQNYVDPYNKNFTYYFWLEQQGFRPSNPKYFHYGADAHQAWAEFLLPKIRDIINAR